MKYSTIADTIRTVIHSARTGNFGNAAAQFNITLQQIQQSIKSGVISADNIKKLTYSLETLFAMQKMENWVAFADILEYETLQLLENVEP